MFRCAGGGEGGEGSEEPCKQISLVCVGSAHNVWATAGFSPTSQHMCFPSLHCSGSRLLCRGLSKAGPGLCALPSLSRSDTGSWVLHNGTDSVGSAFCALPRSKQLRRPGAWQVHSPRCVVCLITSPVLGAQFPGCAAKAQS